MQSVHLSRVNCADKWPRYSWTYSYHLLSVYSLVCSIGGGRGGGRDGAMGLQPHLILKVFHRILIFTIKMQ